MGVPKFFRYISERYPCLSELVKEYQIPEFDNLYLDMNGIIHVCSHPNDFDPHFRISEEQIFKDIFHYIEILFRLIQPQRLFFMAVDGVAPRAKMNQQRGRRFRSAKEANVLEQKALEKGETLPTEERFDSNCITPGTMFMTRLQAQLKYFVACKISTNKLWQKVKVILSGHETPGEGEHKIMDYIRYLKAQPGYDPNTRHCLYGLDADLIMLGLCTHEPHFSLLREEVKFGKQTKRSTAPEETPFYLLHLSLMREYIELEFQALKQALPFPYDLECVIDDWVLMGFLVGNDFIPHLPDMHINTGALTMLYTAYINILPSLGGYINVGGTLRLDRFQKYLEKLSSFDLNQFRDVYADSKYFEGKTGRRPNTKERTSYKRTDEMKLQEDIRYKDPVLGELINRTQKELEEDADSDEDGDDSVLKWKKVNGDTEEDSLMYSEFFQHKNNYYTNKMDFNGGVTRSILRSQAEGYVRAIQWILHYYYNGCVSWSWFYPHHYAPYISDVKDFAHLKIEFELGEPFLPFQQLLAVLPSASKSLLPEPFQELMVDTESPIIEFYPKDFKTDLNGKRQEWEAVVLIPFIEQDALLNAMATCSDRLTDEEKRRNSHGPMNIYSYTEENLGEYEAPEYFSDLTKNHARETLVWREEIAVERSKLLKGLCPGVKLDVYYPGFPTLKHITYTAQLKKAKVKVFENASREDNMILTVSGYGRPKVAEVASQLLNKSIYVEWPHLIEARVVAVSDLTERHAMDPLNDQPYKESLNADLSSEWVASCTGVTERYMVRRGVDIGDTEIVVYCCTMQGRKHTYGQSGKITLEKQWSSVPTPFALQTTVRDIATHDPEFQQYYTLEEMFPPNTNCFMLGSPYYGALGTVMEGGKNGRVKLSVTVPMEPDFEAVRKAIQVARSSYMPSNVAAQRLGINTLLLSRITGSIFVVNNSDEDSHKTNIGLNLKFTKKNEEVVGYTRKENTYWHYSIKAMDLVHNYMVAFPRLFDYLAQNTGDDIFYAEEIFATGEHKLSDVTSWLKKQPFMNAERRTCGSELLEEEVVVRIEQTIDQFQRSSHKGKTLIMQVKPHLLYQSKMRLGMLSPDTNSTHRLLDRIVNVRDCYTVPLALRGTIIGLNKADKEAELMFDVVFDKEFHGGMKINCSKERGYRISAQSMINLSHGARLEAVKTPKPTAIVQPSGCESEKGGQMGNRPSSAFASWNVNTNPRKQPPPHLMHLHGFAAPALIPDLQSLENRFQPAQQSQQRQSMAQPKTEFQAMWSELQKVSPQLLPIAQPPAGFPSAAKKQEITTDSLKKILKITDDFGNVSQIHSYQEPGKVEADKTYCLELMNHFKILGLGCPRYNYIINKKDGTIVAKLYLPDGREFLSTPSADKREAEECVAKMVMTKVLGAKEPQRGRVMPVQMRTPTLMATPPQPFPIRHQPPARMFPLGRGQMVPNTPPSLPTPPQKWYQGNSQDGHLEWRQPRYHTPSPQAARNIYSNVAPFTQNKPYLASGNGSASSTNWHIPVPAELIPPQASQQPRPMNTTRLNRKTFISQEPSQRPQPSQPQTGPPAPSIAVHSKQSTTDDQPISQRVRKSRIAASFSVPLE